MAMQFSVQETDTLLRFLLTHVKDLSRNSIKSLLSRRQVSVDGRVVTRFDHPLRLGQQVSVAPVGTKNVALDFPILFEDEALLVIDKPAGLLTIATEDEKLKTAYHQLTAYVKAQNPAARIYVVHRLDRDTSGLLLFAKNEQMKRMLQDNWDSLLDCRAYLAVVEGKPPEQAGCVRSFLHETQTHLVYSGPKQGGKEAITQYELLQSNDTHSLLRLMLETGRKNQIRVHMKDLDCPVVGDKKYDAKTNPLKRLALHACELSLCRPDTGETLRFTAATPASFAALLAGKYNRKSRATPMAHQRGKTDLTKP